jgi:hypothetical protein
MQIHQQFPKYEQFSPLIPVWCVTPDRGGCIHRFFDTSPFSPSGRYLAVVRLGFEDHRPKPGDRCQVVLIDLQQGTERVVGESRGWETQMGANVNWGATDHELYFNDVDTQSWQAFAWKVDPFLGARERMEGTVYHASPDGKWLISANMTTMRKSQPGYGVCVPDETVRWNVGPAADDGFTLTDTATGKSRLLLSLADAFAKAKPAIAESAPGKYEIYGFHSKFNPQSDRVMLSMRWFPAADKPQWDWFGTATDAGVRFAWVTMKLDGSELHCAIGPEQWVKGGHHAMWFPDGWRISMNLAIDRQGLRLVQANGDGSGLRKMHETVVGSGHPTVHPDGRHVLTDAYAGEKVAFGDGTVPLRWIDLQTGQEQMLVRMSIKQACTDSALRIDPHPAWDRTWRYVAFNGAIGGTRRVFVADMEKFSQMG